MLVVYSGAAPIQRRIFVAVVDDNVSKELVFRLERHQGSIDLAAMTCFVKVESGEFMDKIPLTVREISDSLIDIHWSLGRAVTSRDKSLAQLQFEDTNEDIVWQTEAILIVMSRTIPVDEYIVNEYPTVLQDHERRIGALEEFEEAVGDTYATKIEVQTEDAAIRDEMTEADQALSDRIGQVQDSLQDSIDDVAQDLSDYETHSQGQIAALDSDIDDLEGRKVSKSDVTFAFDSATGRITLGIGNSPVTGEPISLVIDIPTELIVSRGYYDAENERIVLVLANGSNIYIPVGSLIDQINAGETATIVCSYNSDTNTITASLKNGSVTLSHLDQEAYDAVMMKSAFELHYGETPSSEFPGVTLPYYELRYAEGISVVETESVEFPGVMLPSVQITY